jgi:hypothetical protein
MGIYRRASQKEERQPSRRVRPATAFAWLGLMGLALLAHPSRAVSPAPPLRPLRVAPELFASGDLLFRQGRSLVSRAVLAADGGSEYSHVGIVSVIGGRIWVIHSAPAEEPGERDGVAADPIATYLAPEKASAAALYRPRDRAAAITAERAAWKFAEARLPFDSDFDLASADKLYCTELVWRAYRSAGVDLAPGVGQGRERYLLPSRLLKSSDLERIQEFREEEVRP